MAQLDDDFYNTDEDEALLAVEDGPVPGQKPSTSETSSEDVQPSKDALVKLNKFFGHKSFRPLQWEIIRNALDRRDQLVVMSTGYGKSICYQIPSLLKDNLTLVVSPLISLMNDQVTNARANGVEASCLNGETQNEDRNTILEECLSGRLRLLYITPEFGLNSPEIVRKISSRIGLLAIDEAHCVSQWGHEFRPDYRRLSSIREIIGDVPLMALTATATPQVKQDIIKNLQMRNAAILCTCLDRSNLYLEVRSPTSVEGLQSLVTEVDDVRGKHFGGPTIVYCRTRAAVQEVHKFLAGLGVKCAMYHANLSSAARRKAHENFVKDKITTIVATVAFGMGIDKPDVRNVIHFGAPRGIESYYQEIGRAGRDGFPSKCIVFYSDGEIATSRNLLMRDVKLREPYKTHAIEMQRHMEMFLTGNACRRFSMLSHFDTSLKKSAPRAGCCDICDRNVESENDLDKQILTVNYGAEAELLLRAIDEVFHGQTGLGKVIDFLKGKANVRETKQKAALYGAGARKTEAFWKELGRVLRLSGYFQEQKSMGNEYAYTISLSQKAHRWLRMSTKELILEPTPALVGRIKICDQQGRAKYLSVPAYGDVPQSKILGSTKQRIWKDCSKYDGFGDAASELSSVELERELFDLRTDLAIQLDCGAHTVASNKCIQQLATVRPSCVQNLHMIGEMPEEKRRKFGQQFVDVCIRYSKQHSLPMDCNAESMLPKELSSAVRSLTDSNREVYQNHVKRRLPLVRSFLFLSFFSCLY
ncbi:putative Werner syndrome ATP-dependent helicase -like protein 1 [Toxocara canis]|uniref:DNA 3'-5' helicase n=1 Tax=Toxocara canis TaxID=6265 RepID=A0A0B2UYW3_TOXCA|nr:putative Werner syndrome ATP-dependent helicase -like protein 1 [Toxocara canis]